MTTKATTFVFANGAYLDDAQCQQAWAVVGEGGQVRQAIVGVELAGRQPFQVQAGLGQPEGRRTAKGERRYTAAMDFATLINQYGLLAVLAGSMLEGESVLLAAGYAAHRGYLDFPAVVAVAWLGAVVGDQAFLAGAAPRIVAAGTPPGSARAHGWRTGPARAAPGQGHSGHAVRLGAAHRAARCHWDERAARKALSRAQPPFRDGVGAADSRSGLGFWRTDHPARCPTASLRTLAGGRAGCYSAGHSLALSPPFVTYFVTQPQHGFQVEMLDAEIGLGCLELVQYSRVG